MQATKVGSYKVHLDLYPFFNIGDIDIEPVWWNCVLRVLLKISFKAGATSSAASFRFLTSTSYRPEAMCLSTSFNSFDAPSRVIFVIGIDGNLLHVGTYGTGDMGTIALPYSMNVFCSNEHCFTFLCLGGNSSIHMAIHFVNN